MDEVLYICIHFPFNSCLCTFSCAIPTSLFIFYDFICVNCQRLGCTEENARHFCHVLQLSTYLIVGIVSVFILSTFGVQTFMVSTAFLSQILIMVDSCFACATSCSPNVVAMNAESALDRSCFLDMLQSSKLMYC